MTDHRSTRTAVYERYWKMLVVIAIIISLSSVVMASVAGAEGQEIALIGGFGLLVGIVVAAYIYSLLLEIQRG